MDGRHKVTCSCPAWFVLNVAFLISWNASRNMLSYTKWVWLKRSSSYNIYVSIHPFFESRTILVKADIVSVNFKSQKLKKTSS